jgi:branched-chain amino acid transport system substrate-binding protein
MSDRSRPFRFSVRRPLAVLACFGLVGAVGACGSSGGGSAAPGVTDTTITLGTHQPLTGPAAAGYSSIAPATKAYFDYVNAKGGVNGRKIKYLIKDDGYNPANTQKVVRELVLKDKVFAILNGLGTPTHTGVLGFLKTNKVPDLFVASGSRSWNQPTKYPDTFGFQPDYTTETKISGTYIKKNFAGKKVCFFGQDDDFGADALKGLQIALGDSGVTESQKYVVTNTNVAPQMGKLKSAGCQVVQLATVPGFTALALATAAKIDFRPQWVSTSVGADLTTLKGALGKAGSPLLEGLLATNYLPDAFDDNDPWIKEFKKINADYNDNAPFTGNTVYGMTVGYLFVQALKENGKDLTRASIEKTIEKGNLTGTGIVPMRFSTDDHTGYGGARMGKIANGTQQYFGPTYRSDDSDTAPEVYNGAANTPPAGAIPK